MRAVYVTPSGPGPSMVAWSPPASAAGARHVRSARATSHFRMGPPGRWDARGTSRMLEETRDRPRVLTPPGTLARLARERPALRQALRAPPAPPPGAVA